MKVIIRFLVCWFSFMIAVEAAEAGPRNVVLVTIDGLRWQEVFRGADEALMDKTAGGVPENVLAALRHDFLADTAEERRERLMPFSGTPW